MISFRNIFKGKTASAKPEKIIDFYGYQLYYSEGTSIVDRLLKTGSYEPETLSAMSQLVTQIEQPVIVDIGANIGFISLFSLSVNDRSIIYAFEPGPHQFHLFEKTISLNKLKSKVVLSDVAFSDKQAELKFMIHDSEDASGDGFVDTKRAGRTKAITVKSISIDQWWTENNNLHVDIVKMDTEGSELLILQGGRNFFSKVKPKVLIEINEKNIKHYPYTSSDLFKEIESLGFVLYRLNGEPLDLKNWDEISVKEDTFLMK